MFEIEWNLKKSVLRNLLQIKGISKTLALKTCAILGISPNTLYSSLSPHKIDQLNLKLSLYRKNTTPLAITPLPQPYYNPITTLPPLGGEGGRGVRGSGVVGQELNLKPIYSANILHIPILSNLDEFKKDNIKILVSINALRGKRLRQGYPVRGQRTRSNARTANKLNRVPGN